jgi:TolB-like protein/DNA-binding winged helix-turn-helix (wHTH) protein/Flp pilus assembly protein TadD
MSQHTVRVYEFGPFQLDALRRRLLRDGRPVPVTSKVFDTLLVFVERRGRLLPKEELMAALWPETAVEENNLTQHVSTLRKALGERAGEHRYVVTVPGRGYAFVAQVNEVPFALSEVTVEERTVERITIDVEEDRAEEDARAVAADSTLTSPAVGVAQTGARRSRLPAALALCAVVTAVAVAGLYLWGARAARTQPGEGAFRSVAVLPFRTLDAAGADDMTGAGVADALTARLSNVRGISVRPASAVVRYEGRTVDAAEAGRALGVDAVVEGTVQRSGERVRVTVQLIEVRGGQPVWAESFDERFTDIFALQDAVSGRVARAVVERLAGAGERQRRGRATESVEAYESYLRGRHFWNKRNAEGVGRSVEHFRRAIDLDPAYGAAYAGLADAYSVLANYRYGPVPPAECMKRARAAAERALEIDDTLAEAHASLALVKTYHEWDAAGAESEYRRAIELDPSYATAHHWYSDFLALLGRTDEALAEARRAHELDPLSPIISTTLAERFYFARDYDSAAAQLARTLELDENFIQARLLLGMVYVQQRRHEEGTREILRAHELSDGRDRRIAAALGHAYGVAGRKAQARRLLGELSEAADEVSPSDMALVLASVGERDAAFAWMQKARDKAKTSPEAATMLRTDPRLDRLRTDPKFRNLFTL